LFCKNRLGDRVEYPARTCLEMVAVEYTALYTYADEDPPILLNFRIFEVRLGIEYEAFLGEIK
jgi:hypothetical protein